MPKLDLANAVFTGKFEHRMGNYYLVTVSPDDRKILGLKGNSRIYIKKIPLPPSLRKDDIVGVKIQKDAFDYLVTEFVSINGVQITPEHGAAPAPSPSEP